jgi:predicted nuclease with TOPRIM domain
MNDDDDDDVTTTILTQIADTLEEHNKIFVAHRKHLERLLGEVAELNHKVKELEAANYLLNSSDAKFLANVSARLKNISRTLEDKP